MPDQNGWHLSGFTMNGQSHRYHYCEGADHDTLVVDTPTARREHLRACTDRQRKARASYERELRRLRLNALKAAREARRG